MTGHRVRVRPPHSHFGLIVMSSIVGAVMAVPVAVYGWLWPHLPFDIAYRAYWLWIVNLSQAAVALIPFVIFIIWLVRQCQHRRWVAAAGAAFALGMTLFTMLIADLRDPQWAFQQFGEYLIVLAAAPLIGAALALAAMAIYRALGKRVIEQDGTLCQSCAYPVGRSQSAACPECGSVVGPITPTRSERCIVSCARWGRSVAAAMIGVLAIGYALVIIVERDYRVLGAGYSEQWLEAETAFFDTGVVSWWSPYLPVEIGGHEAVIAVIVHQRPVWRRRTVELNVGHVYWGMDDPWIKMGDAAIAMPVPRELIADVLRNGPPDRAIRRLIEAAEDAEWQPSDAWSGVTRRVKVDWPE